MKQPSDNYRTRLQQELQDHLEDSAQALSWDGLSAEQAKLEATKRLGDSKKISSNPSLG